MRRRTSKIQIRAGVDGRRGRGFSGGGNLLQDAVQLGIHDLHAVLEAAVAQHALVLDQLADGDLRRGGGESVSAA